MLMTSERSLFPKVKLESRISSLVIMWKMLLIDKLTFSWPSIVAVKLANT